MPRWEAVRDAWFGSWHSRQLWLIQLFANPVLFALFCGWLLLQEENTGRLVLSGLLVMVIAVSGLTLHAGTLNYFCDRSASGAPPLKPAFARALRHLPAVLVWAGVGGLIWLQLARLDNYGDALPAYVRSTLPVFLRRHITLGALMQLFEAGVFVLRWILTPGLLLPLALLAAHEGFRGFGRGGLRAWKNAVTSGQYWIIVAVAAVLGVFVCAKIIDWTPKFPHPTLPGEMVSLIARLLVAYALGLGSWMLVCSMLGRRSGLAQHAAGDAGA